MEPPPTAPSAGKPSSAPTLELLDPSSSYSFKKPVKQINEGHDVPAFLTSKAYRDIGIFVLQLNRALCPRKKSSAEIGGKETIQTFPLTSIKASELPASIKSIQELLQKADALIEDAPPDPGPRRFGNVAFRTWHSLLEGKLTSLLQEFIPASVLSFGSDSSSKQNEGIVDELSSYFVGAFGSAQRLDYGTGHELSFLAFLGALWKLRFFEGTAESTDETSRLIVLGLMEPYLKVVRRLILTYTLEPAGSHGVWGLDDHSFLPYVFGSAQLTRAISEDEPMPTEGSVRGAPRTADIVNQDIVGDYRGMNMYFSAIGFINDVKKGPFWEHSPILYDVSGIKDGWGKINKGMIKMFNAEVLSKFPVVQHFHFGALFSWDQDPEAAAPAKSIHLTHQPPSSQAPASSMKMPPVSMPPPASGAAGTAAPWASATQMPGATARPSAASGMGAGISSARAPPTGAPPARGMAPPPTVRPGAGPGPQSGVLGAGAPASAQGGAGESADGQITMTKAPWAK